MNRKIQYKIRQYLLSLIVVFAASFIFITPAEAATNSVINVLSDSTGSAVTTTFHSFLNGLKLFKEVPIEAVTDTSHQTASVFSAIVDFFSNLFSSKTETPEAVVAPVTRDILPASTPTGPTGLDSLSNREGATAPTTKAVTTTNTVTTNTSTATTKYITVTAPPRIINTITTQYLPSGITEDQVDAKLADLQNHLQEQFMSHNEHDADTMGAGNVSGGLVSGEEGSFAMLHSPSAEFTTLNASTLSVSGDSVFTGNSTFSSPLKLSQASAPTDTADKLYNLSSDLYWNGNLVSGAAVGVWNSDSGNVYRPTGNVGIGTTSPYARLSVAGDGVFDGAVTASTFTGTSTATSTFSGPVSVVSLVTNGGIVFQSTVGNTVIGKDVGSGFSGNFNTFVGNSAGRANTTGVSNVFVGHGAGFIATSSPQNVAIGLFAGLSLSGSNGHNTIMGYRAGQNTSYGSENTFLGHLSGSANTTGSQNTCLGVNSCNSGTTGTLTNATAIGYNAQVTASNSLILGNGANVGIGTTSPAAKLSVQGNGLFSGNISAANITATGTITGVVSASGGGLVVTNPDSTNFANNIATFTGSIGTVAIDRYGSLTTTGAAVFTQVNTGAIYSGQGDVNFQTYETTGDYQNMFKLGYSDRSFNAYKPSSTTGARQLFSLGGSWIDSTDSTRLSRVTLSAFNSSGAQEGLRIDAGATNPTVVLAPSGGNVGIGTTNPTTNNLQFADDNSIGGPSGQWKIADSGNGLLDIYSMGISPSPSIHIDNFSRATFSTNFLAGIYGTNATVDTFKFNADSTISPNNYIIAAQEAGTTKAGFTGGGGGYFAGNVGIGTTSPWTKTQIAADNASSGLESGQLSITGSTNPLKRLNLGFDTTSDFGYINAGISGTAWKPLVLQNGAGYVGIGSTSPSARLSINGNGAGTTRAFAIADNNNIEKFTVLDNGNVGIGITNPLYPLHVNGHAQVDSVGDAGNTRGFINFGSQSIELRPSYYWSPAITLGINGVTVTAPYDGGAVDALTADLGNNVTSGANIAVFKSQGSEKMRITNAGNVGIGTTSPSAKLALQGNALVSGNISAANITATGTISVATLSPLDSSGTFVIKSPVSGQSANRLEIKNDSNANYFSIAADGSITLRDAAKIVLGDSNHYIVNNGGGAGTTFFDINKYNFTGGNVGIGTSTASAKLAITSSGTGTGRAFVIANSSDSEKFTVLDNGNVGIGTTNPGATLDVNGNIKIGHDEAQVIKLNYYESRGSGPYKNRKYIYKIRNYQRS